MGANCHRKTTALQPVDDDGDDEWRGLQNYFKTLVTFEHVP